MSINNDEEGAALDLLMDAGGDAVNFLRFVTTIAEVRGMN